MISKRNVLKFRNNGFSAKLGSSMSNYNTNITEYELLKYICRNAKASFSFQNKIP